MNKLGLVFAGAMTLAMAVAPADAFARGGHHGGGHHGGFHHGGGRHAFHHFGRPHFGMHRPMIHRHFGGRAYFVHRHFGRFAGPWGWRARPVFVARPYPVFAGPRFAGGFGAGGCDTHRNVSGLPDGWRKIVTVRTCIVR
jgi:hypothetical protein